MRTCLRGEPLLLTLSMLIPACGPGSVGESEETSETSETSETAGDGDGDPGDGDGAPGHGDGEPGDGDGVPGDGDGAPPTGECSISVMDHADSCTDNCPIISDLLVRCDSDEFGEPGLRVAPAASGDGIYLVTAGDDHSWFGELGPDGSGNLDPLPKPWVDRTIALAQGPDGAPYLAADLTDSDSGDYPGGVTFSDVLAGTEELVFDRPDKYTSVLDFELDSQGRAHVWVLTDAPDERTLFVREGQDTWSPQPAPVPGNSGWQRYAITSSDTTVAFDFVESPANNWRLFADEGMGEYPLSTSFGSEYPGAWALSVSPALPSLAGPGPSYLFFSQHESSFRVAAPSQNGFDELLLPDAEHLVFGCLADYDGTPGTCPESCEEVTSGLYQGLSSVARTSDGRVWAAWSDVHVDQTIEYTEGCDDEVGCWCNGTVLRNDSWAELVLAQVDLDESEVTEVFRITTLDPRLLNLVTDRESPRALDMRAWDDRLAIGLLVRSIDEPNNPWPTPNMRLLVVDASAIP